MNKKRIRAKDLTVAERIKAPTPKFFRIIRNVTGTIAVAGTFAAGIGAILVATGVAAPVGAIMVAAGKAAAAMGTASALPSALVVDEEALNSPAKDSREGERPLNTPGGF